MSQTPDNERGVLLFARTFLPLFRDVRSDVEAEKAIDLRQILRAVTSSDQDAADRIAVNAKTAREGGAGRVTGFDHTDVNGGGDHEFS